MTRSKGRKTEHAMTFWNTLKKYLFADIRITFVPRRAKRPRVRLSEPEPEPEIETFIPHEPEPEHPHVQPPEPEPIPESHQRIPLPNGRVAVIDANGVFRGFRT